MTVARILADKGRCVVTTRPERTLQEISVELTRHSIGALVVIDANDDIVGLVSERDVVVAIAGRGPDALSDAVRAAYDDKSASGERRRYRRVRNGDDDDEATASSASYAWRPPLRSRLDWRRRKTSDRSNRTRTQGAARLYRDGVTLYIPRRHLAGAGNLPVRLHPPPPARLFASARG